MDHFLIDLSEDNVEGIFLKCLTSESTQATDAIGVQLMSASNGFEKEDNPIYFDLNKVNECKELIDYLFGQLYVVHHSKANVVNVDSLSQKYDESKWASKPAYVLQLCYLGIASKNCRNWLKNKTTGKVFVPLNSKIVPIPYSC